MAFIKAALQTISVLAWLGCVLLCNLCGFKAAHAYYDGGSLRDIAFYGLAAIFFSSGLSRFGSGSK